MVKKIYVLLGILLLVGGVLAIVDVNYPYHYLKQIARSSTNMNSLDENNNGRIDAGIVEDTLQDITNNGATTTLPITVGGLTSNNAITITQGGLSVTGTTTISGNLNLQGNMDLRGIINMNGNRIINLGDPTQDNDAVNKKYVDEAFNDAVHGTGTKDFIPIWTGEKTLGDSLIYQAGNAIHINPQDNSGEGGELVFKGSGSVNDWRVDNLNGNLRFFHDGSVFLKITPSGNVGIGESDPSEKLVVKEGNLLVRDGDIVIDSSISNREEALIFNNRAKLYATSDGWLRAQTKNGFYVDNEIRTTSGEGISSPIYYDYNNGQKDDSHYLDLDKVSILNYLSTEEIETNGLKLKNLKNCNTLATDSSGNVVCGSSGGSSSLYTYIRKTIYVNCPNENQWYRGADCPEGYKAVNCGRYVAAQGDYPGGTIIDKSDMLQREDVQANLFITEDHKACMFGCYNYGPKTITLETICVKETI